MKITRTIFIAALSMMAAAAVSCQKDELRSQEELPVVEMTLDAATEASAASTKLTLGEDLKPEWEDADKLAVWDGSVVREFSIIENQGTSASFRGEVTEGSSEYVALYPFEAVSSYASGAFTATIPSEQVIAAGDSVATGALMALAVAEDAVLSFKNVCGLIRFKISKENQIKAVIIEGNKGEAFAGEGTVTVENGLPKFTPTDNGAKVVTIRPEGDDDATFAKGTYYAAVAPVTFSEGFTVTMRSVNSAATVTKTTDKEMKIERNKGQGLADLVQIADWTWEIYNVDDLLEWNAAPTSPNHRVQLMADLDMTGVEWTPKTFQGVFEGRGHKIYNFTINRNGNCGFVEYLNKDAVIRNLILGSKDGETYDGVSKFTYTPGETAGSWVHVGSVAAKVDGNSLMENVTNFINLETPDSEGTAKVCMGGITSMGAYKETIRNCVNYGNVTCNASKGVVTGASNHQLGGIISKTDGSTQIIGCKNYGTITAGGAYVDNIGGIIANPNGNSSKYYNTQTKEEEKTLQPLIKDCYNYGNIVVTKAVSDAEATPMALGGIVGKLTGATVENCHNEGNISSVCDVLTAMGGVVGAHALSFESKIIGCSNGVQGNSEKGILTFAPEAATQQMVLGGILGRHHSPKNDTNAPGKLTVQNCNNYAPIATSYIKMRNVGGVVGAIALDDVTLGKTNVEMLIDQCHNHGAITIGGTGSYQSLQRHIAGIAGVVSGSDKGVTISNCTNNAVISTTATGGGEHKMAGIVGYALYGTISVSGCTNNGEIMATGTAKNPRPAGIASVIDGTGITISGCYNKAKISNASTIGTLYVGGIVAYSVKTTITDCHNEGRVEVTKTGGQIRIGGVAGHQTTGGKILQSTNSAEVYCSANYVNAESHIGGIVGNAETSAQVEDCINKSTATVTVTGTSFKPRIGGVIGRADAITLTGNVNEGHVTTSTKDATNKPQSYIGGIAGWANSLTIENCQNKGLVDVTACSNTPLLGGILGKASSNVTIKNCRNASTGKVHMDVATGTFFTGGIIAQCETTTKLQYCYNDGEVKISQKSQHAYVGGIVGLGKGVVEYCENTATGTVIINHTGSNSKYALAGGIVAKTNDGTLEISNCKNYGVVKATVNTSNKLTGAGGIIGQPRVAVTLRNNENHGAVIGENPHTSARIYVGGIAATDAQELNATGATTVTGNVNYGTVTLSAPTPNANSELVTTLPGAAAGGIFGLVVNSTMPTAESDYNINYGTVTAVKGDSDGHAGALAGASNIASWSGKVGKNVKVNGVLCNDWPEGGEAAWLCPSATNALSATYVDAPIAE